MARHALASLLDRRLDLLLGGRIMLSGTVPVQHKLNRKAPYRYEIEVVSRIAFRELGYAAEPDGLPLDPAVVVRETLSETAAFEAEPYDLEAEMPKSGWPTMVVSGGRESCHTAGGG